MSVMASQANRLVNSLARPTPKQTSKHYWPSVVEWTSEQWFPLTKNQWAYLGAHKYTESYLRILGSYPCETLRMWARSYTKFCSSESAHAVRCYRADMRIRPLSHLGRVTHICVSKLSILGSSHYLNQCWHIVNLTLGNKLQWNLNRNWYVFFQENAFENVVWKMAAICLGLNVLNSKSVSLSWRHHACLVSS